MSGAENPGSGRGFAATLVEVQPDACTGGRAHDLGISHISAGAVDWKGNKMTIVIVVLAIVALVVAAFSIRILKQYERGVQFRLGRVKDGARGPGLIFIVPLVDRVHRVSLRIVTLPIQSQGIITKDNVSVDVSAVAYYRVVDPVAAVVAIENVESAIDQIAQTTLRAVVGRHTLDERCRRPTRSTAISARSSTFRPRSGDQGHRRGAQGYPAARAHQTRHGPPG